MLYKLLRVQLGLFYCRFRTKKKNLIKFEYPTITIGVNLFTIYKRYVFFFCHFLKNVPKYPIL